MGTKLTSFIRSHALEFVILVCILLIASFYRLYKIDQYMRFLGDEGRDALVILHMVRDFHFPLIGPVTSVGNMYAGPLYYYMMLIPMAITMLNPIAAAVMVALVGVGTVFLIYIVGKLLVNNVAGLVAALVYAISYLPVSMAKSSWNPYPMPFFALLIVLGLYKLVVQENPKWLLLVGVAFAFAVQMHWLGLILFPVIALFWVVGLIFYKKSKKPLRQYVLCTLAGIGLFLALMSPLFFFDLRHDFLNYKAFMEFFGKREQTVNLNPFHTVGQYWTIYNDLYVSRFLVYGYSVIGLLFSIILPILLLALTLKPQLEKRKLITASLLLVWIGTGIIGMSLVKSHVYDHYFGFVSPAIYLLFGAIIGLLWQSTFVFRSLAVLFTIFLFCVTVTKNPLLDPPGKQLYRTQDIAKYVVDSAQNKPYNFALIAKNNYDDGYEFFFTLWRHPMTPIDPQRFNETKTDQLFVVCEEPVCKPENNDRVEIANYGWKKIDSEATVDGIKIFRLVPSVTPPTE